MAKNQRYTHADHISVPVPEGVKSGHPVIIGQIAGVAQTDRRPDGTATVWLDGSYMLDCSAAVKAGAPVYLDSGTQVKPTGTKFFGVAMTDTAGAGLAEIAPAGIVKP